MNLYLAGEVGAKFSFSHESEHQSGTDGILPRVQMGFRTSLVFPRLGGYERSLGDSGLR